MCRTKLKGRRFELKKIELKNPLSLMKRFQGHTYFEFCKRQQLPDYIGSKKLGTDNL